MEMDSLEKSLKTTFVGAANQMTQLYTSALNNQKQAYAIGYNQANRDTLEVVLKSYASRGSIPVDELLDYLKNKLEANGSHFENSAAVKQSNEARTQVPPTTFFKFENGFTPSSAPANVHQMGSSFNFASPVEQQSAHQTHQQGFSFLPPQMPNQMGGDLNIPFSSNLDIGMKKRPFDIPTNNVMECSYPEQFYKKSRTVN